MNKKLTKKVKTLLLQVLSQRTEEILELIDKHDPNVGLERKTSKHFWGNILREEIKKRFL